MNKHIVIVGGGSAGWMAATMMADSLIEHGFQITVIESSDIPTVGVGEGSTPFFKMFFKQLGIDEADWMPHCQATYKTGILFPDWCTQPGFEQYFHPFYSEIDQQQVPVFFAASEARRQGYEADTHPDEYFVTGHLAQRNLSPLGAKMTADYGYHFDAGLLGQYLRKVAVERGVLHIDDEVLQAEVSTQGNIASVLTKRHGHIRGDYFVDCTGFRTKLIGETLGRRKIPLSKQLLCDAAVALPIPHKDSKTLPSATMSAAIEQGWVWKIPLRNRMGTGLVYSRAHVTDEQASQALREHLGVDDNLMATARHLHWQPSRLDEHWCQNCLAIGLSQGFLEPLEAAMLNVTQQSIAMFIDRVKRPVDEGVRKQFNQLVNDMFDGTTDYLQAHYKLNSRVDHSFWRDGRDNPHMSDALENLLNCWENNQPLEAALRAYPAIETYKKTSWFCLLAGLNHFPTSTKAMPTHSAQVIDNAKHRASVLAEGFYPHRNSIDRLLTSSTQKDLRFA